MNFKRHCSLVTWYTQKNYIGSMKENVILGIIVFGIIISCFLNALVILGIIKKQSKMTLRDMILTSLTTCDLVQIGFGYFLELYGYLNSEETPLGLCKVSGYIVSLTSLSDISLLVSLSLERYFSVVHPNCMSRFCESVKAGFAFILPACFYGSFWATIPLLGLGDYTREPGSLHRCTAVASLTSTRVHRYTCALLLFCFVLPMIIIGYCYYCVQKELKQMITRSSKLVGKNSQMAETTRVYQRQAFTMCMIVIIAFLVAWTPYALTVFLYTISPNVSVAVLGMAALFAKFSVVSNPIIYALCYKDFRRSIKRLFSCSRRVSTEIT